MSNQVAESYTDIHIYLYYNITFLVVKIPSFVDLHDFVGKIVNFCCKIMNLAKSQPLNLILQLSCCKILTFYTIKILCPEITNLCCKIVNFTRYFVVKSKFFHQISKFCKITTFRHQVANDENWIFEQKKNHNFFVLKWLIL